MRVIESRLKRFQFWVRNVKNEFWNIITQVPLHQRRYAPQPKSFTTSATWVSTQIKDTSDPSNLYFHCHSKDSTSPVLAFKIVPNKLYRRADAIGSSVDLAAHIILRTRVGIPSTKYPWAFSNYIFGIDTILKGSKMKKRPRFTHFWWGHSLSPRH